MRQSSGADGHTWTATVSLVTQQIFDFAIVGGGIVGLATARALTERHPATVLVLEAEERLAAHQSGRNSGVIHSGLYYEPGSLKAVMCAEGREALYRYCQERGIAHRRCGKLVVATCDEELPTLDELARRGAANGLVGLTRLDAAGIGEREPWAAGVAGLWVPETGVVSYTEVVRALAREVEEQGGTVSRGTRVTGIRAAENWIELLSPSAGRFRCRFLINCAGLASDRVARLAGATPDVRIVPFRGDYFELAGASAGRVRGLIYPVPDPKLPFLGVHLTRTVDDRVLAGPNAVLALSRTGYRRGRISLRDTLETLGYRGFWKLAWRFWPVGVGEIRRSLSRRRFAAALCRLVPTIDSVDLRPAPCGIRAQAIDGSGAMVDDFRIVRTERALHLLNAPSPAATASLAIGARLAASALESLAES